MTPEGAQMTEVRATMASAPDDLLGPIQQVDAGVLSVSFVEHGPRGGPAVVLLHGWPYDIHSFDEVTPLLATGDANQGGMMTVSDELARLSVRAKQAEDRAAAAKAQARDQLEKTVQEARDSTQQTAEKLRSESAAAMGRADAWADNMQRSWNEHLAQARSRHDERKARRAADRAESDAEDAEAYAAFSIDLAYSAIEEAEYAVLDAVLTRADADSAKQTGSS